MSEHRLHRGADQQAGRSILTPWLVVCLSVASAAAVAQAQPVSTLLSAPRRLEPQPISPFTLDGWTSSQGLPEETISAVLQTRDGYLWLGSFSGLARFDGVSARRFTTGNTPGVRSNRIHSLLEDRQGTLWIGTEGDGVFALRDGVFSTPSWNASLPDQQIWSMTETRDGALWFGTNHDVARVDEHGQMTTYSVRNGLPSAANAITEATDGTIWIGLWPGGVVRIVDGKVHPFRAPGLGDDALVCDIYQDAAGIIWIGTAEGLFRVEGERVERFPFGGPSGEPRVRSIVRNPRGGLWLGTDSGLWHVDGSAHTRYTAADGLLEDDVQTLQKDREGNLWIALYSSGLQRLKPRLATTYLPQGFRRLTFVPIVGDGAGGFWAGSICQGLWHFRDGIFEHYGGDQLQGRYCFWALHRDPDGTLWLGGSRDGMVRLAGGRVTVMPSAGDAVNAILRDQAGALWIGTNEGLRRLVADDRFETYPLPVSGNILFLAERRAGGLWLGTSAGLFAFDQAVFTRWSTETGLSNDIVRAVLEDPDGTLWLGTDGGGLNRMKDGRVTHYTTANGLFDDVVSRILDDGRGHLWMTGSKGVFRVARTDLTDLAEGRAARLSSIWYDTSDGMLSSATAGGGQPAGWQAPDGQLWFPTTSGLVSIDPAAAVNTPPPLVALTGVVVDQRGGEPTAVPKAAAHRADLVLSPGARYLEIHYTGLSLDSPQKVQFRYRLVGYDEQWVEAGTRRVAYYSYLPPGRYRFEVRARNAAGVWSPAGAALRVRQAPHFYQTPWFATLCAVTLILLAVAGYRLRLKKLLHRTQELESAVSARTTEVVSQSNELAAVHQQFLATHEQLEQGHRELTKAHGDLLAILDQTGVGVCLVDGAGVVGFLSVGAEAVLGCSSAEAAGRPWQELLPLSADDLRRAEALLAEPAARRARLPMRLDAADGRRYWIELDARDDPRNPSHSILYLHDVNELYDLQGLVDGRSQFQGMVGESAAMRIVYRKLRDVATVDSTVVLEGETGTGKELAARAIHDLSARRGQPYLAVNCAGLTESLLSSQLFGHRRGAFTGAVADQTGLFEAASGGTLLLDEVGDIPPGVQASLLRVLQEGEITRVGESRPRKIDVRVVAATHRDLDAEVAAGRFRQDLFYRLRVARIHLPPLRERRDDIPLLVAWFLDQARATGDVGVTEVSREAMDLLLAHPWPGNVRELQGVVDSAALAAEGAMIEVLDLPPEFLASVPDLALGPIERAVNPHQRRQIQAALEYMGGNRAAAARLLGLSRSTLYRRLRELDLEA